MGSTTAITLLEAARRTGLDKSTLRRQVKAGKLSASRGPNGVWLIEPVRARAVAPSPPCGRSGQRGLIEVRRSALLCPPQCGPGGDASLSRRARRPEKRA
jgi:hypothetical protein